MQMLSYVVSSMTAGGVFDFKAGAIISVGVSILILIAFGLLAINQSFKHGSDERFSNINIFAKSDEKQLIIQKINLEREAKYSRDVI